MSARVEVRCSCGRTIVHSAGTHVGFADSDGMLVAEAEATHALLNCHAIEHGRPQTLMVALAAQEQAA